MFTVAAELREVKLLSSNNKELHRTTTSLPVNVAVVLRHCMEVCLAGDNFAIFRGIIACTVFFRSVVRSFDLFLLNRLTPNDPYMGRTAPLTSKRYILYIYLTNIGTEYFKHALYSPFFFSSKCSLFHNANLFGSCIIHILYTGCVKIKNIISAPKG